MLKNPSWEQEVWNLQKKTDTEEVESEVQVIEDACQVQLLMQRKIKSMIQWKAGDPNKTMMEEVMLKRTYSASGLFS